MGKVLFVLICMATLVMSVVAGCSVFFGDQPAGDDFPTVHTSRIREGVYMGVTLTDGRVVNLDAGTPVTVAYCGQDYAEILWDKGYSTTVLISNLEDGACDWGQP